MATRPARASAATNGAAGGSDNDGVPASMGSEKAITVTTMPANAISLSATTLASVTAAGWPMRQVSQTRTASPPTAPGSTCPRNRLVKISSMARFIEMGMARRLASNFQRTPTIAFVAISSTRAASNGWIDALPSVEEITRQSTRDSANARMSRVTASLAANTSRERVILGAHPGRVGAELLRGHAGCAGGIVEDRTVPANAPVDGVVDRQNGSPAEALGALAAVEP